MNDAIIKEYGAIKKLLETVLEDIPFNEMLESVIGRVVSSFGSPAAGGIWVMEDSSGTLKLKAFRGLPYSLVKECSEIRPGECVCGESVKTGLASYRADGCGDVEMKYGMKPQGGHYCVPLVFRGKTLGVMGLFMDAGHRRSEMEEEFVAAAANIVCAVMDRKRREDAMEAMSRNDRVTGLSNIESFTGRVEEAIAVARHKKRIVAVLTLDLDRFRVINETMGFEAGNELLFAVARRLKGCFFEGDILARTGEDEFAALLLEVRKAEDTFKVIRKVFSAISRPFNAGGAPVRVTAAVGVSIYPSDGESAADLLKNSRTAMYRAKETGRNGYRIYSPAMNEKAATIFRMEGMMQKALEKAEFILHYQPKCDLKTGLVTGVEALIRWQSPEMGLVSPADFIPIAEESGMIIGVGEWVLKTACAAAKRFHDAGFALTVSVNLSPSQFKDPAFPEKVARTLKETGLPPGYLEFELTESVIIHNAEEIINAMRELKENGIRFSIDDFGIGYSSLSYLKRLPIDVLKIDRSFITNLPGNSDDVSIAVAITRFAHSLKLDVVAEGVETSEQLDFLRKIGCDVMQGYFFSRPLPEDKLMSLLKEGKSLNSRV